MINEEEHKNVSFWFITTLVFTLLILSNSLVLLIGWIWFYNSDMKGWWVVALLFFAIIDFVYAVIFTKVMQVARYVNIKTVILYNTLLAVLLFLNGSFRYFCKIDWLAVNTGTAKLTAFQEIILRNNDAIWMCLYGVFLLGAITMWLVRRRLSTRRL